MHMSDGVELILSLVDIRLYAVLLQLIEFPLIQRIGGAHDRAHAS